MVAVGEPDSKGQRTWLTWRIHLSGRVFQLESTFSSHSNLVFSARAIHDKTSFKITWSNNTASTSPLAAKCNPLHFDGKMAYNRGRASSTADQYKAWQFPPPVWPTKRTKLWIQWNRRGMPLTLRPNVLSLPWRLNDSWVAFEMPITFNGERRGVTKTNAFHPDRIASQSS